MATTLELAIQKLPALESIVVQLQMNQWESENFWAKEKCKECEKGPLSIEHILRHSRLARVLMRSHPKRVRIVWCCTDEPIEDMMQQQLDREERALVLGMRDDDSDDSDDSERYDDCDTDGGVNCDVRDQDMDFMEIQRWLPYCPNMNKTGWVRPLQRRRHIRYEPGKPVDRILPGTNPLLAAYRPRLPPHTRRSSYV
jgi:hypothetical protein